MAFVRICEQQPIRIRADIREPDVVVVLDPSLMAIVDIASGLKPAGMVVLNTRKDAGQISQDLGINSSLALVDATGIAREVLGLPITNTTMVGALIKASGVVSLESMVEPLKLRFGRLADRNIDAMKRAYAETVVRSGHSG